jgi:uncharacterized surface protein with fasciclin (FAS1) repeats
MRTIMETILESGKFKTLKKAIRCTGLQKIIGGAGPITLFAPTDEAFARLYSDILDVLFRDSIKLSDVLTHHVVPRHLTMKDALNRKSIASAGGQTLEFSANEEAKQVDQALVLEWDIVCSNGVVHIIDAVLMPREYKTKVQLP